ncbi:MAG TPA: ABC transporter substrate binding protein, partial [Usitatibacter sp.]|nr:ABC transporter substrate binding protein [Usitatibacter sp.]
GGVVAVLLNQNNATYRKIRARFRYAALGGGLKYVMIDANQRGEIDAALDSAFRKERAVGVVVMSDALFYDERQRIVKRVAAARRAAIYPDRAYVAAGGLMSYGPAIEANFERAAGYVDRILKGAAPADLPVEEPREYRLDINRRTARALAIKVPAELLKQAQAVLG